MPPSVGMRFGRYELLSRLGAGGMGEVWRARDHDLRRDVAVKFLPERFAADPTRFGRFTQEALAASRLTHPSIVTIHEVGEASGLHYIVMELVEGETLRAVLLARGERPLPARRLLEIATQVADGLAKAHAAGIVHRDLKPENVMVMPDGFVKILDFGLVKLLSEASGGSERWFDSAAPTVPESPSPQTAVGAILGTAGYMSPEQARGRAVDYRSDQFSLGAILYEMATGRQAFLRETPVQTIAAIIEDAPEPIASLNPSVPAPVRWLIEGRCLAKDPAERYASTVDLARDLRQLRDHLVEAGGSMPARTSEIAYPRRRLLRRAWLAPALAVLVAAGWWWVPALVDRARVVLRLDPVPSEKRIAVLPFEAPSGTPEDRATGEGIAYFLTARLGELERFQKSLWVEPAGNVLQLGVTSAEAARRAFGASLVLSGSVQRARESSLVLTVALEDARRNRTLRAATADSLDGLAREAVRMLDLEIGPVARDAFRAAGTDVAEASTMAVQALGYAAYSDARNALERHEQQKSLERAITLFQQSLARDPDYALAYAGLAEANWRLYRLTHDATRVELARKACERALRLNDLLAPVHVTLGVIRAGTGEAQAALADFDRALALDPANADALRERSIALERLDRPKDAEAALFRAIELRPEYWANHNALGVYYWRYGRHEEAERALRRAVGLAPDNVLALSNLGGLLVVQGRLDDAVPVLERSMAIRPTYRAASNLALVAFDRGRYAQAARAYERVLELGDHDYRIWRNLALARWWAEGERPRARPAFEQAVRLAGEQLKVSPDEAGIHADLADCEAHLGRRERSLASLRRALALAPTDVEVLATAGAAYEQLGERARAIDLMRKAVAAGYPPQLIDNDPALAGLRSDPRYREVVKPRAPGGKAEKS